MKFISNENVCAACYISSAWQLVVWWIFSKTKEDIRLHSETQAWMRYHHLKRCMRYMYMYTLHQNFDFTSSEFLFSLNLWILIFAFSTIVHLNVEVLMAEIPVILCAFPLMKLLTIKCYDWSSKWASKMCTASVVRTNLANKTNIGNKPIQAKPFHWCLNSCKESLYGIV